MKNAIPICCWPYSAWLLFKGVMWGWIVVLFTQKHGKRLIWKCWYWPGYVHPWRYKMECAHGRCHKEWRGEWDDYLARNGATNDSN